MRDYQAMLNAALDAYDQASGLTEEEQATVRRLSNNVVRQDMIGHMMGVAPLLAIIARLTRGERHG